MIFALLRLAAVGLAIYGGIQVYKYIRANYDLSGRLCGYCKGKGYYLGVRGREKCTDCNGTGRDTFRG